MMKLSKIYKEVINAGIEADIRSKKEIDKILKLNKEKYEKLTKQEKDFFDKDRLFNPFADTRIIRGKENKPVKTAIVGIDVDVSDLVLVDRLKEKGTDIDLVISHHPVGFAYAQFYDVMDLQIDIFSKKGISLSAAENMLKERKTQVERRVSGANHDRVVDAANLLDIDLMCMHTPADNFAYRYIEKKVKKLKPSNLKEIVDMLLTIDEYKSAAKANNPPKIFVGSPSSKASNIHIEFTGGTEGPKDIYQKLSNSGIDTIIAMHQSEEHVKKCKEANINVVVASHIASDNIGMNCLIDKITAKSNLKILEFSGFKRFAHKKER